MTLMKKTVKQRGGYEPRNKEQFEGVGTSLCKPGRGVVDSERTLGARALKELTTEFEKAEEERGEGNGERRNVTKRPALSHIGYGAMSSTREEGTWGERQRKGESRGQGCLLNLLEM